MSEKKPNSDVDVLRNDLTQFIGTVIPMLQSIGRNKNQMVAAILSEEILKVSQLEPNTPCDLYILVPLFKSCIVVFRQQQQVISQNPTKENLDKMIRYEAIIEELQDIIDNNPVQPE